MGFTKTEIILGVGLVSVFIIGFGVWYTHKDKSVPRKKKRGSGKRNSRKKDRRDKKDRKRKYSSDSESSYESDESSSYSEEDDRRKRYKKKKTKDITPPSSFTPKTISPVQETPAFKSQIDENRFERVNPPPVRLNLDNIIKAEPSISPIRS